VISRTQQEIEAKCRKEDGPMDTQCWVWQGYVDYNYYGMVYSRDRMRLTHREMYFAVHGFIPDGCDVHHKCYNKTCCNPDHLEAIEKLLHRSFPKRPDGGNHHRDKTHCLNGHEFTPENTYSRKTPTGTGRVCRECLRQRARLLKTKRQHERKQQQCSPGYTGAKAN
jgi:hypothetical protein